MQVLEEESAAALEDGASQPQSDIAPAPSHGAAAGLGDRAFHSRVADAAPSMSSPAVPSPAPAPARSDDQTASTSPLLGHSGAGQATDPLQHDQPAQQAAENKSSGEQPVAGQAAPAPQPLQPAERLAKGREVMALMQECVSVAPLSVWQHT